MTTSHDTRPVTAAPATPNPPPAAPPTRGRRLWPQLAAGAAIGAALATLTTLAITSGANTSTTTPAAHAPVIVTAAPPPGPAPLPLDQANRQTCQGGWGSAGRFIDSAIQAMAVIPQGVKVGDPAFSANADWTAAAKKASGFYSQASDSLETQIAAGTSPILVSASNAAVSALRSLSEATSNSSPLNGNTADIADAASAEMAALCTRLAP